MSILYPVYNILKGAGDSPAAPGRIVRGLTFTAVMIMLPVTSQITTAQDVKINTNLVVEADGTLRLDNSATVWNDLMVYPDATTKGGSNPPEWGTSFM